MPRGKLTTTKEYRDERRQKCMEYIRRTNSLDEARKLAKANGFGANVSVWIGAYSKLLEKLTSAEAKR